MTYGKIVFATGLLMVAGSAAQASRLDGTYDGHCDGFSLTTFANGDVGGVETGCESGPIAGVRVTKFTVGGGKGAAVNENHVLNAVYEINTTAHTWAIFDASGDVVQSGTWTPVAAGAAASASGLPPTGSQ